MGGGPLPLWWCTCGGDSPAVGVRERKLGGPRWPPRKEARGPGALNSPWHPHTVPSTSQSLGFRTRTMRWPFLARRVAVGVYVAQGHMRSAHDP